MNETGHIDQFQLLEEKVDFLIELITDLKKDKALLTEKIQVQERKITELTEQVGDLNTNRDRAKQRIVSLLEKIKQIDM